MIRSAAFRTVQVAIAGFFFALLFSVYSSLWTGRSSATPTTAGITTAEKEDHDARLRRLASLIEEQLRDAEEKANKTEP